MSWRQFKREPEGFKGSKCFKPPETTDTTNIKPLKPLKPAQKKVKLSADEKAQQASSDWRWFCDSHERTLPDSHCPVKHSRDPFSGCIGWQIKAGKVTLN